MRGTRIISCVLAILCGLAPIISGCGGIRAQSGGAVTDTTAVSTPPSPTPRGAVIPTRAPTPTPTIEPTPTLSPTPGETCSLGGLQGRWIAYGDEATGAISDENEEALFCFLGAEGDWVSVSLEATSGDLDTYLSLVSLDREVLVGWNDDAGPTNFNSELEYVYLPDTGAYGLVAGRYSGAGDFRLRLDISGPPFEDLPETAVPLIPDDSGSVLRTGTVVSLRFMAGDVNLSGSTDVRSQMFLSYDISSLPAGTGLIDAELIVTSCHIIGEPFDEFGPVVMEWLPYGSLDPSDYGERALGAIPIAQLDGCPQAPINVQRLVQMALERGYEAWQIKVAFSMRGELIGDGRADTLIFGAWPVLLVDY